MGRFLLTWRATPSGVGILSAELSSSTWNNQELAQSTRLGSSQTLTRGFRIITYELQCWTVRRRGRFV